MTENSPATDDLTAEAYIANWCPDIVRDYIARIRAEQAKQYELIGYVALEDIQNKPDYFDVATKWNGHNKVPVYALATSANSRAEAIGAARGWIANNMYEGDANAVAIVNALSALLQREGE